MIVEKSLEENVEKNTDGKGISIFIVWKEMLNIESYLYDDANKKIM
jgi:hypothetical protein